MSVSKCGRSVQPQPPPNSTATGLGRIHLAKLAMRPVSRVLLPMRRCESLLHTHSVLGNGGAGQKDHPPFVGLPVSYHLNDGLPQRNRRGRGRFVSTVCCKTDPPALPPCPMARRSYPDRKMVCAQTHTQPSVLASRTPATSFPLYALLRSCPVIHNVGTHNGWQVTALSACDFCLPSTHPWELHCRSHTLPSLARTR